jgi:two-component system, chemotaxis family, CheB/CheR fusion protein
MASPDPAEENTSAVSSIDDDGYNSFPVVAIGASAGGIEAFQQLLANLPPDTGMAFVLVQHLDPHHQSRLAEVLSRSTSMPVFEADHNMELAPNHVYIIPPNRKLAVEGGHLQVTPRDDVQRVHLPIDHLFRSLAREQKARAIGVVLSGTGSDGTQGLAEIKAAGGITLVQDEKSALHAGMPVSAAASGCADFILPPDQIAKRLAEIVSHPYLVHDRPLVAEPIEVNGDARYEQILNRVRAVTGVDFSLYRDATIKRRILRRMALHTQQSVEEYAARLDRDGAEVLALFQDMLIDVTSFFRDPEVFEALKEIVYPQIAKDKASVAPIRVWVPGCSSGQEAYSIALTLVEFFDSQPIRPPIEIFGTDLNNVTALEKARTGVYPESIQSEVSPERLRRFFVKEDHKYRIAKTIRDMCVFARQNVAADPPFSHVDLISCRNLLIYLSPVLQKRVLATFHYALDTPVFLLLGSAESIGESTELFELIDGVKNKIYIKKAAISRPYFNFLAEDSSNRSAPGVRKAEVTQAAPMDFQREADRILLGRYSPTGVLVDQNLDIIQFRGHTGTYLQSPPGEPTSNLLKMAREGLVFDLRKACAEASQENKPVHLDKVHVRSVDGIHTVTLEVIPVHPPGAASAGLLIVFIEGEQGTHAGSGKTRAEQAAPVPAMGENGDGTQTVTQISKELAATKEYLQTLIEQQDAANEELRTANEEILSSNEELQSTNEELETAKEELQSTNEELTTANEHLRIRNIESNALTNDLTNLLTSSDIPIVIIGADLCVRRFTEAAAKKMNLLSTDIGRPIGDLKPPVDVPDLEVLIGEVIDEVQVREREVRNRNGRWNLLRIHPYRTIENKIDGAVILLLDIDDVKRVQTALSESEARLRLALEGGSAGTFHRDLTTGDFHWGELANQIFGLPAGAAQSYEKFIELIYPEDRKKFHDASARATETREKFTTELRIKRPGGQTIWLLVKGQGFYSPAGQPLRLSGVIVDISEQRKIERSLQGLIDTTQDAVISIDRRAHIVMFNPSAERIFGYTAAEVVGKKINLLMAEPYATEHDSYIARYEAGGQPQAIGRIRTVSARRKSGEIFPIELSVTQIASGEEVNYAAFIRDISEKAQLQKQAVESERLATIGTMAAKFGHELGNPLNGMSLTIQLLEQRLRKQTEALDPQIASTITRLRTEITRLDTLLQDFRSLSRKETYNLQSTSLAGLVREAIEIVLPQYIEKGVEVESHFPAGLPPISVDIDKMKQVILNLAKNAVEAMPEGGKLSFNGVAADGVVTLKISDTGVGIPHEVDIFEPFYTTKTFGTGIGMTIVRQIVAAHGGNIEYHSEPGRGTTFSISVPSR